MQGVFLAQVGGLSDAGTDTFPVYGDGGVIPHEAAFVFGVVEVGAFVGEGCCVSEDAEAVGKAFWDIKHILLFTVKNYAVVFTKGG